MLPCLFPIVMSKAGDIVASQWNIILMLILVCAGVHVLFIAAVGRRANIFFLLLVPVHEDHADYSFLNVRVQVLSRRRSVRADDKNMSDL